MSDVMTKEQRTKNMKAIKSVSKLESIVSRQLWHEGYRFRRNTKTLMGRPDLSIKKYKVVVFIDSCFFHQCPQHGNMPKTNTEFWKNKLTKNVERDRKVTSYYKEKDWYVLRIWEHEVKEDLDAVIDRISSLIEEAKKNLEK